MRLTLLGFVAILSCAFVVVTVDSFSRPSLSFSFKNVGSKGFTTKPSTTTTILYQVTTVKPSQETDSALSYGERSRVYRRDVFAYGDWVNHRDSGRFVANMIDIFNSGILRQLTKEIIVTTSIATFIVIFNALFVKGYDDFAGIHHAAIGSGGFPLLAIPAAFFTLTSPALSLLLGTLLRD